MDTIDREVVMKCDELIEKIKQADDDYRHKFIPINLDIEIEDILGAFAELKRELEDVQATAYAESVDAGMENRKLKRSLWLARALRAKECKYKYETWERHEERKVYKDYDMIAIVSRKARMWRKVERKCRAKAEEYK